MAELTYEEIKTLLINVAGRMDYEELKDFSGEVTELLRIKSYAKGYEEGYEDAETHASERADKTVRPNPFKLGEVPMQPKRLTRAEVVAKAKADLDGGIPKEGVALLSKLTGYVTEDGWVTDVDFVVNRYKRTVDALMRGVSGGEIYAKGIAKCAPTDCFNEYIGKAIALRRALGLEVPEEYLDAPQPEGVEVGDIIDYDFDRSNLEVVGDPDGRIDSGIQTRLDTALGFIKSVKVIDDSARYKEVE